MTVLRVKEKLMTHVGSNVSTMRLQLKDWDGTLVAHLDDDTKMLGYYSPEDGWTMGVFKVAPLTFTGYYDWDLEQSFVKDITWCPGMGNPIFQSPADLLAAFNAGTLTMCSIDNFFTSLSSCAVVTRRSSSASRFHILGKPSKTRRTSA